MDKFIEILCTGEFWIAVALAVLVSFIFATIAQDIYDTYMDIENTTEYCMTHEALTFGCTVRDIETDIVGIYCGTHVIDDKTHAVVVAGQDNMLYFYYPAIESLVTVEPQE